MSIFATLHNEIRDVRVQDRNVVHIRVTTDALTGSVAALPITPERARTLGTLLLLPNETVAADPRYERLMEILVHPEDWRDLLTEQAPDGLYVVDPPTSEIRRVFGIPVVEP